MRRAPTVPFSQPIPRLINPHPTMSGVRGRALSTTRGTVVQQPVAQCTIVSTCCVASVHACTG
eukprot:m.623053 g.623053  ORF g.623053 m.623053 type:complete len:63 (-) comp22543_c0_seq78:1792-1980(-)